MSNVSWQKILHGLEVLITIIFLVAVGLWVYEPTRAWVIHYLRLSEKPTEIALMAVVVNGIALLLVLLKVGRFDQKLDMTLTKLTATSSGLIENGVMTVYQHLREILHKHVRKRNVFSNTETLEVLGLTLFSAWLPLRGHLSDPDVKNWDIRLFCLAPDYISAQNSFIPDNWKLDAELTITHIKDFVRNQTPSFQIRNLSITLTTYGHFPGLHGFRIGGKDGDILFSLIDWRPDNFISYPDEKHHFYEHISPLDESARANLYRRVFDNWISVASNTGQQIAIP